MLTIPGYSKVKCPVCKNKLVKDFSADFNFICQNNHYRIIVEDNNIKEIYLFINKTLFNLRCWTKIETRIYLPDKKNEFFQHKSYNKIFSFRKLKNIEKFLVMA